MYRGVQKSETKLKISLKVKESVRSQRKEGSNDGQTKGL